MSELKTNYVPTTQTKLKSTISIHTSVPTPPIPNAANKQVNTENQINTNQPIGKHIDNIQIVSSQQNLNPTSLKQAISEFVRGLPNDAVKEILQKYPVELKGKDNITLFLSQPDQEALVSQIKNELLAFLQQKFENPALQFLIRKPYTDSEKLFFLKYKYNKVNDLANKLGLDLI